MTPHKFRHGHAVYALTHARDVADLKAVSMNLMHSSIGITDSIYAVLSDRDMQERIARLGDSPAMALSREGLIAEFLQFLEAKKTGLLER